jgi:hypothetical protein
MQPQSEEAIVRRLEADGLIRKELDRFRTTRRFTGAMMRAALQLRAAGDTSTDLRVPVAHALLEIYGDGVSREELIAMVMVVAPIEARELDPAGAAATQDRVRP